MNWINKALLFVALAPRRFFARWNVDIRLLKAILTTKLMMDDRRPNSIQLTRQRQTEKEISNATLGTMAISGFMGLSFLMVFALGDDFSLQLTLLFSLFIAILCMMLVSDFTSVLFDVRDNDIILPKPVNDATVVVARLLHVFVHICKIILPMCLPSLLYLSIRINPFAGLVFLAVSLFVVLFSIFLINAVYIIILRITTPARFKTIISYVQIGFVIFIYGGSQVFPRLMDIEDLSTLRLPDTGLLLLAPPYWFASLFEASVTWHASARMLLASALAIVMPLLSMVVVIRFLAPAFNQKLGMISGSSGGGASFSEGSGRVSSFFARFMSKYPVVHTGFLFTWKMIARSREFKLKVYPTLGYFFVLFLLLMFNRHQRLQASLQDFFTGFDLISVVYMSSLVLLLALIQVSHAEKFKAAWMFYTTPLRQPGQIVTGAVLAVILYLGYIPFSLLLLMGLWYAGPTVLLHFSLALCNQLVISLAFTLLFARKLPFSQPPADAQSGAQTMWMFLIAAIAAVFGGLQYLVFKSLWLTGLAFCISILICWWLIRRLNRQTWEDLAVDADLLP
ncbi:MAG: hypothetical protein H6574_02320 [Lewinellaceae bacterium]|nr:hypothetical protein [Saprospiraceae bacterium]MCB9329893.1 hypothetical protein [Lewinellaceae bacterium]